MRKFLTRRNIVIAVVLLLVVGVIGWNRSKSSDAKKKIATTTVERRLIEKTLVVSGTVKAAQKATLNFPSAGKLSYVNVVEGATVIKGQLLASLDKGDLSASERATYYRYLAADANAKEVEDQVKGHDGDETFAQKNDRVSAQTSRDIAYDNWLVARRALTDSNLYAPFAGVATSVTANAVGDTVSVADGVSVVNPSSLYFEIEIDESDLGLIQVGMAAKIKLDSFEDKEFTGTISSMGFESKISSSGATVFPARITFSASDMLFLRLGMNGDAEMTLAKVENALSLPVESVNEGEVTLAGQEKTTKIVTGLEGDEFIEVKSGLKEGDVVIK